MTIKISSIHFCPVKSVSYQAVDHCNIHKDIGLEGDRVFAFLKNLEADDPTLIDKEHEERKGKWNKILTLKNTPALNKYNFSYGNEQLTLYQKDQAILSINSNDTEERKKLVNKIIELENSIKAITQKYFNSTELLENVSNYQIFLNKEKIEALNFTKDQVAERVVSELENLDGIYKSVTAKTLQTTSFAKGLMNSLQNGYNQKLSGDVLLIPYPATLTRGKTGTSHGTGYSYDTHIPIIFYGKGIKKGVSRKRYEIIDIAPTISNLLRIEAPNSSTGRVIEEALVTEIHD